MARPLRVDVAEAWYHVMNRGHRGEALFLNDADRRRFLGAVAELPERFALELHALVLMDNQRRSKESDGTGGWSGMGAGPETP